ncbi:MAG: hypothetical protein U1E05_00615, partial [Patescibacteria group bacterium]|nr:hypothetical protein [Patescibacteria group bacterium]
MKMLCPLLLLLLSVEARADWYVWTVTDTRRVVREAPGEEGCEVRVAAVRNEFVSFQVLARSGSAVPRVSLEAADLAGPDGAVLHGTDARLFRAHQLHLEAGTFRNEEFASGWYPDPLIPHRNPTTQEPLTGARFVAMPFDLPAGQTHGFWVDIYLPPDTPPGEYRGTYRLIAEGEKPVPVPVTLTVWDITLPTVSAFKTSLG